MELPFQSVKPPKHISFLSLRFNDTIFNSKQLSVDNINALIDACLKP